MQNKKYDQITLKAQKNPHTLNTEKFNIQMYLKMPDSVMCLLERKLGQSEHLMM